MIIMFALDCSLSADGHILVATVTPVSAISASATVVPVSTCPPVISASSLQLTCRQPPIILFKDFCQEAFKFVKTLDVQLKEVISVALPQLLCYVKN